MRQSGLCFCVHEVEYVVSDSCNILIDLYCLLMEIIQTVNYNLPQKPNVGFGGQFKGPFPQLRTFLDLSCALVCSLCPQNGGRFHAFGLKLPL